MGVELLGAGAIGASFFIGFAVLVGGFIWLAVHQARRHRERREALVARVAALGYSYVPEDPGRTALFTSTPFGIGMSRRAADIVWGQLNGRAFETFAYKYETESTDAEGHRSTTTHRYQVTWIPLPNALPTMRLTSDNAVMRLFAKMGAKDLEVESHQFNQRWKVWCADERIGHAVLTPKLIDYMLAPGWAGRELVIEGRLLMTYVSGHTDLTDLEQIVYALYDVVDCIPPFLWTQGSAS